MDTSSYIERQDRTRLQVIFSAHGLGAANTFRDSLEQAR